MKFFRLSLLAAVAGPLLLASGCGSAPQRIDPDSSRTLITTGSINVGDWQQAAVDASNSLIESGVLRRTDGRKNVVAISTVRNKTKEHIETNIMTNLIRQTMLRSGQAIITTAVAAGGAEDAMTHDVRQLETDPLFARDTVQPQGTVIAPDLSLAGEIIQLDTTHRRTNETYFQFHLTLTDLKTGLAVWEETIQVVKQETRGWFGW